MEAAKGPCPHMSVPVEMDESMTPSSLDLALPPPCKECSGHPESGTQWQERDWRAASRERLPAHPAAAAHPHLMLQTHSGQTSREPYRRGAMYPSSTDYRFQQAHSVEQGPSLEAPLPLTSDIQGAQYVPPFYHAAHAHGNAPIQERLGRQCACCPPANLPHPHQQSRYDPGHRLQLRNVNHVNAGGAAPPPVDPPRPGMHEVSVTPSMLAGPGPVTREIRKTISLSEECRNVFVTYSVDVAKEMIPFAKFLTDYGFEPAIDIFDNPIRRLGFVRWMDRYLNDKSVLIIVVISPKYKEDVEGDGDEEHGLHTKYIHNQIQNEFIQHGCLNFRLVPVLFPNATKKHVPSWLRSTRIYRWPQDTLDLLLRLVREERYIPQRGSDPVLTIRPI